MPEFPVLGPTVFGYVCDSAFTLLERLLQLVSDEQTSAIVLLREGRLLRGLLCVCFLAEQTEDSHDQVERHKEVCYTHHLDFASLYCLPFDTIDALSSKRGMSRAALRPWQCDHPSTSWWFAGLPISGFGHEERPSQEQQIITIHNVEI